MNFIRIIIFLAVISPFMAILSGCYNDAFFDAIHEEEDFIAPFDVVLSEEQSKRTMYFPIADTGSTRYVKEGDDSTYADIPKAIQSTVNNTPDGTADPVVIDSVTGLVWTKCSAKSVGVDSGSATNPNANPMIVTSDCSGTAVTMEWSNAVATCRVLNKFYDRKKADGSPGTDGTYETGYGGYNDWRLPRLAELLSIANYNFTPAFDPTLFPLTKSAVNDGYWTFTSKLFLGENDTTTDYGWIVFHGGGGFFGNNLSGYKAKQENLVFEKQYIRCVRGGLSE